MTTYDTPLGLAALGDPTRQAIFDRLAERPLSVQEIADQLPVSRPAVSQHLKVLKSAGLVSERAVGARRVYRLEPAAVGALRDQLDTYWRRALSTFDQVVDAGHGPSTGAGPSTRTARQEEDA